MAVEHEIVNLIEKMIHDMLPKSYQASPPQKINVGMFNGGSGTGMTHSGELVDFTCHPLQDLMVGDVVVGVPIGPKLYYIVGKR
jgi:hypothetical protein